MAGSRNMQNADALFVENDVRNHRLHERLVVTALDEREHLEAQAYCRQRDALTIFSVVKFVWKI